MCSVFRGDLFVGKVCLVTGGGTGIGKAVASEFSRLGATVLIASRNLERLEQTARTLTAAGGGPVSAVKLDIRDHASVNVAFQDFIARYGRIDVLVNNGGGQFASPAAAIRPKGWCAVVDTNLNGTWFMSQALYLHTPPLKRPGTSIINVTADFFNGFPGMAHTGAARAAVDNLTKTLAREWGPEGIRINSVAPGIILSSGIDNYPEELRGNFFTSGRSVPLGRPGTESEIASAVVFLASPGAHYITGATLRVDGGSSLSKRDFADDKMLEQFRNLDGVTGAERAEAVQKGLPPYHSSDELRGEYEGRMTGGDTRSKL